MEGTCQLYYPVGKAGSSFEPHQVVHRASILRSFNPWLSIIPYFQGLYEPTLLGAFKYPDMRGVDTVLISQVVVRWMEATRKEVKFFSSSTSI